MSESTSRDNEQGLVQHHRAQENVGDAGPADEAERLEKDPEEQENREDTPSAEEARPPKG